MSDPFLAEVVLFAGTFAPKGWAFCNGQLLAVSSNQALYGLLGNIYGGNGASTFALPDLRSRVPIQPGTGSGLSNVYTLGGPTGAETVALTTDQMPQHTHGVACNTNPGTTPSPANAVWAEGPAASNGKSPNQYATGQTSTAMATVAISSTGAGAGHANIQPTLALNYIIAITGIYPSRP